MFVFVNICRKHLFTIIKPHRFNSARKYGENTIFSLSSGFGKCGVSVIRVSGPQTRNALKAIVGTDFKPKPRYAQLKALYYPNTAEMIDKGLVLWFPGPASFTGEDACEFQVHGSQAVIEAMLTALGQTIGLRAAEPGEFTRRAFHNGKLDLTEAEGLADLIHAETEAQRKQALLQSNGALSRLYNNWRARILRCSAHLEAYIDFADDEQIEPNVIVQLQTELKNLISEMRAHLSDQRSGELLRDGVRTAIVGAPNVGKSSLMNKICQRPVSIVTPIVGTTRDIIETRYSFGGYPVLFADTAGLRKETKDIVELEGIAKTKNFLTSADLVLLLMDARQLVEHNIANASDLENYTRSYMQALDLNFEDFNSAKGPKLQVVANKTDLLTSDQYQQVTSLQGLFLVSCMENQHFDRFSYALTELLKNVCGTPTAENPRITHTRYRQQLERCIEHVNIFLREYSPDIYPDMAISAQKLRNAVRCIEVITGQVSTEHILDVVFRDFCIGK